MKPGRQGQNPTAHQEGLLAIGKIVKPWGLKGDVKVQSYAESVETYQRAPELYVPVQEQFLPLKIERVREHQRAILCKFKGYDRLEDVLRLVGATLYLRQQDLPPLEEGEYYWHQLIGMDVLTDGGRRLGTLSGILNTGSSDIYVVREGEREWLIPALRDIVVKVDLPGNRMIIHPIEGLLGEDDL